MKFTACYTKLEHGYMGQILEWPGVITEGDDLKDCEEMLKDAAREMALSYYEDGSEIPEMRSVIVDAIDVPIEELTPKNIRVDVIRYLGEKGFFLEREGDKHSIYKNDNGVFIPVREEKILGKFFANELCKEAEIPAIF